MAQYKHDFIALNVKRTNRRETQKHTQNERTEADSGIEIIIDTKDSILYAIKTDEAGYSVTIPYAIVPICGYDQMLGDLYVATV